MTLKIIAISDEHIYPHTLLPRTLIDIIEVIGKYDCEICLLQPGSKDWESNDELFHVITFTRMPSHFRKFFKVLEGLNEPVFKAIASSLNPKVYRILFRLAKSSDLIMCYCIQHSIPALITAKITRKPIILIGDILYIAYYRKVRRVNPFLLWMLLMWERSIEYLVDKIVVWGADEKKFLVSSGIHKEKIKIIPLSINLRKVEMMSKKDSNELWFRRLKALKDKGFKIIMFHGNLHYAPNKLCCNYIVHELAPRLLQKHSNIVFAIVGPNFSNVTSGNKKIIFTGYVENLFSYIRLADIGIVPLTSGSGVKNKVLEYFALSKPVITTKIGAENLNVKNMVHCIVTDPGNFPDKISFLLKNPELMTMLGANARKYIEENHPLENYEIYVKLVKDLVKMK